MSKSEVNEDVAKSVARTRPDKWQRLKARFQSGIYCIRNTTNGKLYYGSSLYIPYRIDTHRGTLRKNKHHNKHLQAAWNKYGESSFSFSPVVYCAAEHLEDVERWFVKRNPGGYNKGHDTVVPMRGRKHTEETKRKMREASRRQVRKPIPQSTRDAARLAAIGRKKSPETIAKLSASIKARWADPEYKARLSRIQKERQSRERRSRKNTDPGLV